MGVVLGVLVALEVLVECEVLVALCVCYDLVFYIRCQGVWCRMCWAWVCALGKAYWFAK